VTALLGSALLLEIVTATAIHAVIDMATKRETEGTDRDSRDKGKAAGGDPEKHQLRWLEC